jgi:FkbH-like protein
MYDSADNRVSIHISESNRDRESPALEPVSPFTLAIAATFTAEPVEEPLRFWADRLDRPLSIEFAPYSQVFQQLLDPTSLLLQNQKGINVVLVRLEDWEPNADRGTEVKSPLLEAAKQGIERNIQELAIAFHSATERSSIPYLVCICPASEAAMQDSQWQVFLQAMEAAIEIALEPISSVYLVTPAEISTIYPVTDYDDPYRNKVGHVPYTPMFYTALGTIVARKMSAILRQPYKVIALDCDRTLWNGVCGEDGALGITLDPPWQALQEFMVAQHKAGMLLCLCSKNIEADVIEVFERRSDMPLQREHIVSWRINWQSKADNLKALAQELNLGLDSFIFIDDNPVECAEVQANCPEVLTLQLPERPEDMPQFLHHVWAFDRLKVTQEDKQRTELYKQNVQREQLRTSSLTLESFLESLNLDVQISEPTPEQFARVAQLTQRTNQFNVTTIRRSESEIQQLCQSGQLICRIVEVKDRFGDYGLVGLMLFTQAEQELAVDTFLLSCRTLGRGVEHRMLAQLGAIAIEDGCTHVVIPYHPTQKNEPALNFLHGVGATYQHPDGEGFRFSFPTQVAAALTYQPRPEQPDAHQLHEESGIPGKPKAKTAVSYSKREPFLRIATELNTPAEIFQCIDSQKQRTRTIHSAAYIAPQTPLEQALAEIWRRAIGIDRVGIHDNFFELGGQSLLATQVFTDIDKEFRKNLPLTVIFQAPTIAQLAEVLLADAGTDTSMDARSNRNGAIASRSALVEIQPNGSKPPIFCSVPAGSVQYASLSRLLGSERPFYVLRQPGLDIKHADAYNRVEELAVHYLREIRSIQPEGPYLLLGYCLGGSVAFEMAQQLRAQGQKVAMLALVNSIVPKHLSHSTSKGNKFAALRKKLISHWQKLSTLSPAQMIVRIVGLAKAVLNRLHYKIYPHGKLLPHALQYYHAMKLSSQLVSSYVPSVYAGKSILFRSSVGVEDPSPDLGWNSLFAEGLEVYTLPGHLSDVLNEPSVRVLAEQLEDCIVGIESNPK